MIYLISDTHFFHKSIIPYCKRPFSSIDEMNEAIIKNWNENINENDVIYFLGDFSFGNTEMTKDICSRLNGYKIMIKGNHDRDKGETHWFKVGFQEVWDRPYTLRYVDKNYNMREILLSHEPQYISDNKFNIHGHIHDESLENEYPDMNPNNHLCVCVERIDYKPISLEEIQEEYLEKFFNNRKDD